MRHRLDHEPPADRRFYVVYGWDALEGYFGELWYAGAEVSEFKSPLLRSLLDWLVSVGSLDAAGVTEALLAWEATERVHLSDGGQRAWEVIETLEREPDSP